MKKLLYAFIMIHSNFLTLNTMQKNVLFGEKPYFSCKNAQQIQEMFEDVATTIESDNDDDNSTSVAPTLSGQSQKIHDIRMISFRSVTEQFTAAKEELDNFEYRHRQLFLKLHAELAELQELIKEQKTLYEIAE